MFDTPYQKGWIAGVNPKAKCPYPAGSWEREDWQDGARDASQHFTPEEKKLAQTQGIGFFLR